MAIFGAATFFWPSGIDVTQAEPGLFVMPIVPRDEEEWARFLALSDNGTLFHELPFLAYHPSDRFRFEHLIVKRREATVALIPGGVAGSVEQPIFTSPLGASVGGPVLAPRMAAAEAFAIVAALQDYVRQREWSGIEFTLAPPVYNRSGSDALSFALFCRGFRLTHRWLSHVVPLAASGTDLYRTLFRDTYATLVRAAQRKGIRVVAGGVEQLDAFLVPFRDTYERHGTTPTHTPAEIADLLRRLPERARLYIAMLDDTPIAGLFVLLLNSRIAYTFYICMSTEYKRENGNLVAIAFLLDRLAAEGFEWIDFGPSAWDGNFNAGVVFFKEGLGALGHCRDRWRWLASETGSP